MYQKLMALFLSLGCLMSFSVVIAAEHEIGQKGKEFKPKSISIKAGDTINFNNSDPFFHNIFSLSEAENFDLGAFSKGGVRSHTFKNSGLVDVECVIHPFMKLRINVEK